MKIIAEVQDLTKQYSDATAVDRVSFRLEEGKIYGMLGRNGAGKTTVMHMLTAQLFPTSGSIRLFGEAPYENSRALSQVCFIKESQKYPDIFRVKDALGVAASFFPNWDESYAESLVEAFRLPLNRRIKKLSRGMLSSVGIIIGLASRAPLTIFDEPYLGLDAVARELFYDELVKDYAEFPRTIVLSTHLIDEVSKLLEHIIVIDNGKIIIDEDADLLRGTAVTVSGTTDKVEAFVRGKAELGRESLGGLLTVTVRGTINETERSQAQAQGLEITPVSLQQLVVQLTKNNSPLAKEAGKG